MRPERARFRLYLRGQEPATTSGNILFLLLLVDALLIGADILQRQHVLSDERFRVTHEAGLGEIFQYCKAAAGVVILTALAVRQRSFSTFAWALMFLAILSDDALSLHERAGDYLAAVFLLPSMGALRGNQIGELAFYGCLGVCCAIVLAIGWYRGTEHDRDLTRALFVWFGALGFFAVGFDVLSSSMRRSRYAPVVALLEDGGEMLIMSLYIATVWAYFWRVSGVGPPGQRVNV
jgi:hypothetical protein